MVLNIVIAIQYIIIGQIRKGRVDLEVAIITTYADKIIQSRYELIMSLLEKGHTVKVLGCESEDECRKELNKYNIDYTRLPFTRSNTDPIEELKFIYNASKIFKQLEIDIVLVYGIRLAPSIAIAAKLAGIKNIYAIVNGAGTLFNMDGIKGSIARTLSAPLIACGLRLCNKVIFQNEDNRNLFIKRFLINKEKAMMVNGSGVNLKKFTSEPLLNEDVFLFVGRILRDKGVLEYINAAKIVKNRYPSTKFILIGPYDQNKTAIDEKELNPFIQSEIIQHIPWTDNIHSFLASCSVFVLPSYHEGIPRTVLEAMATGRAIITTDAPGCRETVVEGINGFLVPVGNVDILAEKMIWMIENREKVEKMGQESLKICRNKYDVNKVNEIILNTMGL